MGKIAILPDALCNQIAAGEVVERPAAVVKELVENSIDAESRKISVALLQGGRKEIRVVDSGTGMSSEDAMLALERHATSKIRTVEDLQAIRSLGFRGEALPSIAAVSRFELITREASSVSGTLILVEGGILKDVRDVGSPPGTQITVRDLFYNIPVRRKFLRSVDTEMSHISDQFLRIAMANPCIHLQLTHEGRTQYDFPQSKDIRERAAQVFGMTLATKLRPFSLETPYVRIHGLAGPPDQQRANTQSMFAYVNGRPVWDRMLNHAILSAYDTLMPKGKFPVAAVCVELSSDFVDVNVHPTKREVRFRNPGEILAGVRDAIRGVLEGAHARAALLDPVGFSPARESFSTPKNQYSREGQSLLREQIFPALDRNASAGAAQMRAFPEIAIPPPEGMRSREEAGSPDYEPPSNANTGFSRLPIVGQIANSYILLEAPDGLIFIDQHAAHERIIYDGLCSDLSEEPGQRLAQSVVIDFLPREAAMIRRWTRELSRIGFEIDSFGGDSFVIQAVPAALSGHSPEALLRDLLQAANEDENIPQWDLLAGLAKTASCHSAVRAGQRLRYEEIRSLLESLDRTLVSATCPHGRPLWFKLTLAEIAKLFLRT